MRWSGSVATRVLLASAVAVSIASCSSGDGEELLFTEPGDPAVVKGSPTPEGSGSEGSGASTSPSPGVPSPTPATPTGPDPAAQGAPDTALAAVTCSAASLWGLEADRIQGSGSTKILYVLRTSTTGGCGLQGYPQVVFLDHVGAPIPVRVERDGFGLPPGSPTRIALTPDTSLSFFVAAPGEGEGCPTSTTVRVALDGASGTLDIPSPVTVCGGAVGVSPVQMFTGENQLGD